LILNCILVASNKIFDIQSDSDANEDIHELSLLAQTLSFSVLGEQILNLRKITPSTYYGKGQIKSIGGKVSALKCNHVIFNDEISPSQYKNIQKLLDKKIKIFDRTGLILEIFKRNAKTKESKFQVELASLQYMLPRLTGQWTHLERQMGGVGTRGGPGEKQIEIDRRLIGVRITKLKKELSNIKKNRKVQSSGRKNIFRASLVGYTNAGKSSLLNALTAPDTTYVKNKLFATLDTTTKSVEVLKNKKVLITDTVGFIKNLPHNLVASFRSTFEEVDSSDLILTVVDASQNRRNIKDHISTIESTLNQMKIKISRNILVFNKIDLLTDSTSINYLKKKYPESVFISAREHIMIDRIKEIINSVVSENQSIKIVKVPFEKTSLINKIYNQFDILSNIQRKDCTELEVSATKEGHKKIQKLLKG
tara:strand:+ start:790 stop:2055 length:1266 start_codon:yes stop_codon:yes gene_type:complete